MFSPRIVSFSVSLHEGVSSCRMSEIHTFPAYRNQPDGQHKPSAEPSQKYGRGLGVNGVAV